MKVLKPLVAVIVLLSVMLYLMYIKISVSPVSRQKFVWWISAAEVPKNFKNSLLDITVKFKGST